MPFLLKLKAEIDRVLSHLTPPLVATPMVIKPMCHLSPPLSGSSFQRLAVSFPLTSPLTPLSPIHTYFPYRRSSNGGMVCTLVFFFATILRASKLFLTRVSHCDFLFLSAPYPSLPCAISFLLINPPEGDRSGGGVGWRM